MSILLGLYAYFSDIHCPDCDELSLPNSFQTEMLMSEPKENQVNTSGNTQTMLPDNE